MTGSNHVYELRTYYAAPGKLDALLARFRDHTEALFAKHNLHAIGYWVTSEPNTPQLIYILRHSSKADAERNWEAFVADSDWKKIKAETDADGPLAGKIDKVFMTPADFSRLK